MPQNKLCDICQESFPDLRSLNAHKKEDHITEAKECHICGFSFKDLNRHLKYKHGDKTSQKKCDICEKSFFSPELEQHIRVVHSDIEIEKKHHCDLCEFSSKTLAELRYHYEGRHLKQKRLKCSECQERFWTENSLNKHVTKEHGHEEKVKN